MTDLDHAAETAARELARRLGPVTTLRDPHAAAVDYVRWLLTEHWRHVPPMPDPLKRGETQSADVAHRGAGRARELLAELTRDAVEAGGYDHHQEETDHV